MRNGENRGENKSEGQNSPILGKGGTSVQDRSLTEKTQPVWVVSKVRDIQGGLEGNSKLKKYNIARTCKRGSYHSRKNEAWWISSNATLGKRTTDKRRAPRWGAIEGGKVKKLTFEDATNGKGRGPTKGSHTL